MAVSVQDVLVIDTVLVDFELLRTESEIAACSVEIGEEIVPDGMVVAGGPRMAPIQGRVLRLPRSRMRVETSAHRTRVLRDYPSTPDDLVSVVRLANQAIALTERQGNGPSSFGANIQIVYDQDSGEKAIRYLGRRLFIPTRDLHPQWEQVGGFGKLVFREGTWQWTITVEPRFNDPNSTKVFLDVNLHVPEARLPDGDEIEMLMRELWSRAHALIETIDGRDNG